MRDEERQQLRRRFRYRCGYCGVHERHVGAELTLDHFQPRSKGGIHEAENWIYCCHACNEFKGDHWQPDSVQRILHPLRDRVGANVLEEADGMLRALTETGTFHIDRLHLNREQLVEARRERRRLSTLRQAQVREQERLKNLLERVRKIITKIRESRSDDPNR